MELHLANKHKDEGVPEHLQIKALNKKRRKSDRDTTTIMYETTLQPEYVTTEFVVTDTATEEAIAAQTIVAAEAIPADQITTETIAAEAIII